MKLDFRQSAEMTENSPEAYEKLLLDCLNGDSTNFSHWDEVAQSWRIVDIIRHAWDKTDVSFLIMPRHNGPASAFDLLEKMALLGNGNQITGTVTAVNLINNKLKDPLVND